jgi:hypothetical protein
LNKISSVETEDTETEDEEREPIEDTDGEGSSDVIEDKDQVGALLQLIQSRASILTVNGDPRYTVVRPKRPSKVITIYIFI